MLSHALNTKGLLATQQGRWETARALIRHALEIALENDIPGAAMRGYTNLSVAETRLGNLAEAEDLTLCCLELARRIGDRASEWFSLGNLTEYFTQTSKWDDVVRITEELPPGLETQALGLHVNSSDVARHRGDLAAARAALEKVSALADSASVQDRSVYVATKFNALMAGRRDAEALALVESAKADLDADIESVWVDLVIAEAALAINRIDRAAEAVAVVEALSAGDTGPLIRAQAARFRASVAAAKGDAQRAEDSFKTAAAAFREYGTPFHLACTQLEHAELLVGLGRPEDAEPLVAEAREIFERLRATPWLERADSFETNVLTHVPA